MVTISYPFRSESGELPASGDADDSIRASIRAIINTRQGERVMRPTLGSKCWSFVFESGNQLSLARLKDEARRAIAANEPRVRVVSVSAEVTDGGFEVTVAYQVLGSGTVSTVSASLQSAAA